MRLETFNALPGREADMLLHDCRFSEVRFGHSFAVFADARSAEELLAILRAELARVTALRLRALFACGG